MSNVEWRTGHYKGEDMFWSAPLLDPLILYREAERQLDEQGGRPTSRGSSTAINRIVRKRLEEKFAASEAGMAAIAMPSFQKAKAVFRNRQRTKADPSDFACLVLFTFKDPRDVSYFKFRYANI